MRLLIATMLVFVAAMFTEQASAQEAGGKTNVTVWEHPGADPYATSDEEAVKKLPDALLAMDATLTAKNLQGIPESARAKLIAAVAESPQGHDTTYITADMTLGAMMWKPTNVVRLNVKLPELPIALEKRDGMYLSARARVWRVEDGGHTYVLYLPDICRNWSVDVKKATPPPPPPREKPPEPECYELHVPTHAGDRATFRIRDGGAPLPPYGCRSYKTGGKAEAAWPTCFECFKADGPMVIYVDRKIAEHYEIEICWEHTGKQVRKGVVPPTAWTSKKFVVPDLETIGPIPKG